MHWTRSAVQATQKSHQEITTLIAAVLTGTTAATIDEVNFCDSGCPLRQPPDPTQIVEAQSLQIGTGLHREFQVQDSTHTARIDCRQCIERTTRSQSKLHGTAKRAGARYAAVSLSSLRVCCVPKCIAAIEGTCLPMPAKTSRLSSQPAEPPGNSDSLLILTSCSLNVTLTHIGAFGLPSSKLQHLQTIWHWSLSSNCKAEKTLETAIKGSQHSTSWESQGSILFSIEASLEQ